VAKEISSRIPIPTIGIAAGRDCDGQILVTTDLLGTTAGFIPKHIHPKIMFRDQMRDVVAEWKQTVCARV
jgi:3-methyl-2-oxobutanoate hydroxymethyltransferase